MEGCKGEGEREREVSLIVSIEDGWTSEEEEEGTFLLVEGDSSGVGADGREGGRRWRDE